jgi:cysteine desulfurase
VNLTSNRIYLDYNATSPFSESVIRFLREGDLLFGNPSSLHYIGKYANRHMREVRDFLQSTFGIEDKFRIIFHSGATEGINFFFRSVILEMIKSRKRPLFLFSSVDHSASYNQKSILESLGFPVQYFDVDQDGNFDEQQIYELIEKFGDREAPYPAVLNFLYVNNETGRIWSLDRAHQIKNKTNALIHVDAVQSIGKIKDWNILDHGLDAYTYSAHKFGALKGIGFTLLNHKLKLSPFLYGGGQQEGLRSGTENVLGIYTIKLALEDLLRTEDYSQSEILFKKFHDDIVSLKNIKSITQSNLEDWSCNTVVISCDGVDSNTLVTAFDMSGVAISSGSACSSGIIGPNRILTNMGYSEEFSKTSIRLSWDPHLIDDKQWSDQCTKVISILERFL